MLINGWIQKGQFWPNRLYSGIGAFQKVKSLNTPAYMDRGDSWRAAQELSSSHCAIRLGASSPLCLQCACRSPRKASLLRGKAAHFLVLWSFCSSSVSQLCPTLCDPRDCSMPGFSVLHRLPEFTLTHVHWVSNAIQPSHPLSSLLLPSVFPSIRGFFPVNRLFPSGGQSIGASASASVLPMNIQDWFPLGLTGLISLLSKWLSGNFSCITVWKHQFFSAQPSLFEKVF